MKFAKLLQQQIFWGRWSSQQLVDYKMLKKQIKLILTLRQQRLRDQNISITGFFLEALRKEVRKASRAYDEETRNVSLCIDKLARSKPTIGGPEKTEATAKLESLEKLAHLNREAVRKILKKFVKKTKIKLPSIAMDLSVYSFNSDSDITILGQKLNAYNQRALDLAGMPGFAAQFKKEDILAPQKLHVVVELTRMRKLLMAALEWVDSGTPKACSNSILSADSQAQAHIVSDHKTVAFIPQNANGVQARATELGTKQESRKRSALKTISRNGDSARIIVKKELRENGYPGTGAIKRGSSPVLITPSIPKRMRPSQHSLEAKQSGNLHNQDLSSRGHGHGLNGYGSPERHSSSQDQEHALHLQNDNHPPDGKSHFPLLNHICQAQNEPSSTGACFPSPYHDRPSSCHGAIHLPFRPLNVTRNNMIESFKDKALYLSMIKPPTNDLPPEIHKRQKRTSTPDSPPVCARNVVNYDTPVDKPSSTIATPHTSIATTASSTTLHTSTAMTVATVTTTTTTTDYPETASDFNIDSFLVV